MVQIQPVDDSHLYLSDSCPPPRNLDWVRSCRLRLKVLLTGSPLVPVGSEGRLSSVPLRLLPPPPPEPGLGEKLQAAAEGPSYRIPSGPSGQ